MNKTGYLFNFISPRLPVAASLVILLATSLTAQTRPRVRDIGLTPGILATGKLNAITDVEGVQIGHTTIIRDENIRTGVTAVLPHGGNLFTQKVPAAIFVGNGFGKLMGSTQVDELGEIETPILLTSTLAVPKVADYLIDYMLGLPQNTNVRSINPIVAETNDGYLNDIRGRYITQKDVFDAIMNAKTGMVEEGSVGAGTGTVAFGWKGGIGTSSRKLPESLGGFTVGVLVQTNFGGVLTIDGAPVGVELGKYYLQNEVSKTISTHDMNDNADGSVIIIIATDAPVDSRNLKRIASRAIMGLARTGASGSNGSGDYAIAFSTSNEKNLSNERTSPLFLATIEATEEAIYNSLFKATTVKGQEGRTVEALPLDETKLILQKYKRIP